MAFVILVGETLERLSGGWHPACVHRVKPTEGQPRFNMAFELRPRCNVWHPWRSELLGDGKVKTEDQEVVETT